MTRRRGKMVVRWLHFSLSSRFLFLPRSNKYSLHTHLNILSVHCTHRAYTHTLIYRPYTVHTELTFTPQHTVRTLYSVFTHTHLNGVSVHCTYRAYTHISISCPYTVHRAYRHTSIYCPYTVHRVYTHTSIY